jgi:hypothetical protein
MTTSKVNPANKRNAKPAAPKARKVEAPIAPEVTIQNLIDVRVTLGASVIAEQTAVKEAYGYRVEYARTGVRLARAHGIDDIAKFMARDNKPADGSNLRFLYDALHLQDKALRETWKASGRMTQNAIDKAMSDIRGYRREFNDGTRPLMTSGIGQELPTGGRGTKNTKSANERITAKIEELAKMLVNADASELSATLRKVRNPVCDLYRVVTGKTADMLVKGSK